MNWSELQATFSHALVDSDFPPPKGMVNPKGIFSEKRFNVYRNNVSSSLIEAVRDGFPMVERLLGEEYFKALLKCYTQENLPDSPVLLLYGENFGDFIDQFPPLFEYPYLGDVARLEYHQRLCMHAKDSAPLRHENLPDEDIWLHRPMPLMHATRWQSSAYPIFDLWQKHYHEPELEIEFKPQSVLLTRPEYHVETRLLPDGGVEFIQALSENASPFEAVELCLQKYPEADATTLFQLGFSAAKSRE